MFPEEKNKQPTLESRPITTLTDKEVDFLRELRDDPAEAVKFVQWVLPKLKPGVGTKSFSSFAKMYSSPAFGDDKLFNSDTNEKLAKEVEQTPGLALRVALKIITSWLSEEEVLGDKANKKPGIIDVYKSGQDVAESGIDDQPIEVEPGPEEPAQLPDGPGPAVTRPDPALDFNNDFAFSELAPEDELPAEFGGAVPGLDEPFTQDDMIGNPRFETPVSAEDDDEEFEEY